MTANNANEAKHPMDQVIEQMRAKAEGNGRARGYSNDDTDLLRWADTLAALRPAAGGEAPEEMSPDFTDSARGAIAWVLYHHQGGSSAVGQPLRFALGMGAHEPLPDWRIAEAKRYAEWSGAKTSDFHPAPAAREAVEWPGEAKRDGADWVARTALCSHTMSEAQAKVWNACRAACMSAFRASPSHPAPASREAVGDSALAELIQAIEATAEDFCCHKCDLLRRAKTILLAAAPPPQPQGEDWLTPQRQLDLVNMGWEPPEPRPTVGALVDAITHVAMYGTPPAAPAGSGREVDEATLRAMAQRWKDYGRLDQFTLGLESAADELLAALNGEGQ